MTDLAKNERDAQHYNDLWSTDYVFKYRKEHEYVGIVHAMMEKFCPTPNHILDVGAGFGFPALKLISSLMVRKYTAYEFSIAWHFMVSLLEPVGDHCELSLYNKSFKGIDTSEYDCVVALEIFEHITWDLEFVQSLQHGVNIFMTVPQNHPSKRHVREFAKHGDVVNRYKDLIDIKSIIKIRKWYCIYGSRK